MRQLDLFDYRRSSEVPRSGTKEDKVQPETRAGLLLIKGNNFLLLPKPGTIRYLIEPKKLYFESYKTLALALVLLMLLSPFTKPQVQVMEPKVILGEQIQVISEIEVNPESLSTITRPIPPPPSPIRPPVANVLVPILMYHHVALEGVHTNALDRALTVSPAEFEEQVVYFKNLGYETVTLRQIYDALTIGTTLPARAVVFTFDDGYQDVFVHAVPVLKKYGYTGTFAIAPFLLGGNNYASWGEVLAAHQQGMEIISHSLNHIDFTDPKYSDDFLMQELQGSKWFLESRLSAPVDFFVYPYGKYDQRAMAAVEKAGYKMALTTEFGTTISLNKAFHNPRVRVSGQNGLYKLKQMLTSQGRNVSFRPGL